MERLSLQNKPLLLLPCLLWAATAIAQGRMEELPRDWKAPADLRRLHVADAAASTVLDGVGGNYSPRKVHDGNRATKWVATDAPSEKAPQWIALDFGRERKV